MGESIATLVERLAANNWWGEIIGPHGSGKSTLLEALKPALYAHGFRLRAIALRNGQRWLPRGCLRLKYVRSLIIVDGYEQLCWVARRQLQHRCRRAGAGLLVTLHAPAGFPTLIHLAPDLSLIQQLVARLRERATTLVDASDVVASHAAHGSNVRDVLFDLYNRHEQLRDAR